MSRKRLKKPKKRAPRRAPSVAKPKRPLLSLAMMVKDEELFLEDALASAKGLVDELIVVDTGSTDRTVEIAKDMGAVVSHFPWCDDFSAARNETLRQATGEWILILDADERLQGGAMRGILPHLKPTAAHPYEGFALKVINTELSGAPISSFFSTRIFPNDPRLGYQGRVHNQFGALEPGAPKVRVSRYLGLEVLHLGYDPQIYVARQKAARSLPLIEATVAAEPDNLQYRFYLGREYLLVGRAEQAAAVLEETLRRILDGGAGPLAETVHTLGEARAAMGRPTHDLEASLRAATRLAPDHPDVLMAWALSAEAPVERWGGLEAAVERLSSGTAAQVHLRHRPWRAWTLLGHARWEMGHYPEALEAYLEALETKPEGGGGWPKLLNNACALAIEFDHPRKAALLERLLAHEEAPLGMFFFEIERLAERSGAAPALEALEAAAGRCPRMPHDPEYATLRNKLA